MPTAIGMFRMCEEQAGRCRLLAAKAAGRGRRSWAIALVAKAQKYDAAREEWRAVVPRWQWDAETE